MGRVTAEDLSRQRHASDADYAEWSANRERNAQAWYNHFAALEIERLRAHARASKSQYDREVAALHERIVTLTKGLEDAEEHLKHISGNERKRRYAEAQTAKKIESVERATLVVADAVSKAEPEPEPSVEKTKRQPTPPRGVRKTIVRDANNRISEVIVEPIA